LTEPLKEESGLERSQVQLIALGFFDDGNYGGLCAICNAVYCNKNPKINKLFQHLPRSLFVLE